MKAYLLLALALSSSSVMAHSHMPQQYGGKDKPAEAVTFTGTKLVPIIVGTASNTAQRYEITVDGKKVAETPLIGQGSTTQMQIPVQVDEPNKPQEIKVCSTSIAEMGQMTYRTRICTYAKLLWVKK